jgi:hypothetical protein
MNLLGHTHLDLFKVAMSYSQPEKPVGVVGVCGSVTTWSGQPSFCVYEVDAETLLPVRRLTYAFDINTANSKGQIEWTLYTDYMKDYAIPDLSPSSYLGLANRILKNIPDASNYNTRMRRKFYSIDNCDDELCMKGKYCDNVNLDPIEHDQCRGVSHFDFIGNFFGSLFETWHGPWVNKVST